MNFIPEQPKNVHSVIYYEQAREEDGWKGQRTGKNIERLKSEVTESITRLGGFVSGFQMGMFQVDSQNRQGFQIHYSLATPDGRFVPGRLDIAALPVKDDWNKGKKEAALKMALFMLRDALDGMWLFQQLSPGYAPLMPFMLAGPDGKTISQLWAESPVMTNLLPPGNAEFIEAEIDE